MATPVEKTTAAASSHSLQRDECVEFATLGFFRT